MDTCQQISVSNGENLIISYQWDQPFFSVSGPPGSASDMDIIVTNATCDTLLAGSAAGNIGNDSIEVFAFEQYLFYHEHLRDHDPACLRADPRFDEDGACLETAQSTKFDTKTGASYGHSTALGGLGVGAARYENTPVFGISPPVIEGFSSAGGSPILFDTAGNRLAAPQGRQQPAVTAPDGADTRSFGTFFGTSAAAPHAAGVTALMNDLVPTLTPDAIYAALKSTAIDMDDPSTGGFDTGFDFGTGFGLVQADAALNEIAPEPEPIPPVVPPENPPDPLPPGVPPEQPVPPMEPPVGPQPSPPTSPPAGPVVPVPPRATVFCKGLQATIIGTETDDVIIGTPGPDIIHGLGGHDLIIGSLGRDVICGGSGKDRLFGGSGRDRLFGDQGRDRLNGGKGRDRCSGGSGADTGVKCERKTRIP